MDLKRLIAWFPRRFNTKWKLFSVFLVGVAMIAGLVSVLTYTTLLDTNSRRAVKIAVIAPLSGSEERIGQSILNGVTLYADQVNKGDGVAGHRIEVLAIDDGNDPAKAARAAEQAARDPDVITVLGHYSGAAAEAASRVYERQRVPAISFAGALETPETSQPWMFRITPDESFEIKFLANYVRNVIGEKLVTIVYAAGPVNETLANTFDDVLQRYGTKVLFKMPVDLSPDHADASLKAVTDDIKDKKLIGAIVVLGNAQQSARTIAALRQASIKNALFGLRTLATDAFKQSFTDQWKGTGTVGSAISGMMMTAPMLFDTAGAAAQDFRSAYTQSVHHNPDWLAAMAYDSAKLAASGFSDALGVNDAVTPQVRSAVRDRLASYNAVSHAYTGINGPVFFDRTGGAMLPTMVGVYDGADLIAGLTQLSPIREEGVANYLQELVAGRALYVNDRFMYKTNVIYSGVRVEKIAALDPKANTVELEMIVWFRWRGNFDPQDIVFSNSLTPIRLETPERQGVTDDVNYRAYRVKGSFFLNFSDLAHPYGTKLVGMTFRHRTLSRNNVMYVSDILGMGLAGDKSLTDHLNENKVLAGLSGWIIDHASLSQELASAGTDGDPTYVGFGRPAPDFSTLNMSIILKPDALDLADFLSRSVMIYLAIFAFAGAVLASLLDRKERGQFWRMQTLLLRIVTWPTLLVTVGTLMLNYSSQHWSTGATDMVLVVYRILWWVVPAQLADYSVERFVFVPLENHSGRKIPNVVRHMTLAVIYLLAIFGIIAFVLGKTITSLLATSGLMAMIIGLAIQSNLKDVFSGIILNIERPFMIGDDVRVGNTSGQVVDITWRTTRIRASDGQLVSFPNGRMSDSEIHNFSLSGFSTGEANIFLDPRYEPGQIVNIIRQCLIDEEGDPIMHGAKGVSVMFLGVEWVQGSWASKYQVKLQMAHISEVKRIISGLWQRLWPKLREAGVSWEKFEHLQVDDPQSENVRSIIHPDLTRPAVQG
jgi:branched-chain amino acid transport system substrate-binding protein